MKKETQFKKGKSGNPNGRPKGTPNKTTLEIRANYQQLIDNNLLQLENDLKELRPYERIKVILELSKFVLPTLKATELSTSTEDGFSPIVINLGTGIPNKENGTDNN